MAEKTATWGREIMRDVEKGLLLQILDAVWKEHLLGLDHLRQGIGLRAYGQKDPLNEYKSEAFEMFNGMLNELDERVTLVLSHMQLELSSYDDAQLFDHPEQDTFEIYQDPAFADSEAAYADDDDEFLRGFEELSAPQPVISRQAADEIDPNDTATWGKVGRNTACPCGSGKKYKHCHGAN